MALGSGGLGRLAAAVWIRLQLLVIRFSGLRYRYYFKQRIVDSCQVELRW